MLSFNNTPSTSSFKHWSINSHACRFTSSVCTLIDASESIFIAGCFYYDCSEQFDVTELFRARIFYSISGETSLTAKLYLCHLNIFDKFINILMYFLHLNTKALRSCDFPDSSSILSLIYPSNNRITSFWYSISLFDMIKSLIAFSYFWLTNSFDMHEVISPINTRKFSLDTLSINYYKCWMQCSSFY